MSWSYPHRDSREVVPIPGTSQVALRPTGCTDWQVVDVGPVSDEITRLRAENERLRKRVEELEGTLSVIAGKTTDPMARHEADRALTDEEEYNGP